MGMKKRVSFLIIGMVLCLTLFVTACNNYTSSLVFYEIQDNDHLGYPTGEIAVVENKDDSIKRLVVPETYNGKQVTLISIGVFEGCYQLSDVNLPEGIKYIESNAFAYCDSLTSITLPESLLFIGWGAFEGDAELANITIGSNVFRIAEKAFKDCDKLKDVYYSGTQEDWDKIEIWEGNECLLNATIHFEN